MRALVISTSDWAWSRWRVREAILERVGGGVEIDGGLLDFEFLLGDAVIDLALLALEAADDFLFGGFEAGAFDGETGVGEVGLVLLGGDFGLGEGLIESGLRLAEGGLLLHEASAGRWRNRT